MVDDGFDPSGLLIRVARDSIIAGTKEPVALHPLAGAAINDAIDLANALGVLASGLDEVLLLAYDLEGAGDSPDAARSLRAIVAESADALAALEIAPDRSAPPELERRGKRLAKARGAAERVQAGGRMRAGDFNRRRVS